LLADHQKTVQRLLAFGRSLSFKNPASFLISDLRALKVER